jgi:hypothetical protein
VIYCLEHILRLRLIKLCNTQNITEKKILANFGGAEHANDTENSELAPVSKLGMGSHNNELPLRGQVESSPRRLLLLLYGASYSEREYQEEKMDTRLPKYTIGYLSSASLWRSAYSRTPPDSFSLDPDDEANNAPEEAPQPSTSKTDPELFL